MRLSARSVFHWQYTGWVIALAGGGALSAALADAFGLAYGAILVCCIYSVACWLTSTTLQEKRPRSSLFLYDAKPYLPPHRRYKLWQAIPSLLLILFFLGCTYFVHSLQATHELEQYQDWLYPSDDAVPYPESICDRVQPLPRGSIALYLGNSRLTAGKLVHRWPVIVPQDRRLAQPVLVVEQDSKGRIAVDLDVRSEDGRIVARIEHNRFVVNRNNILSMRRPDRSTLIVTNQDGIEALNIHYLNRHAIHLTGTFYVVGQHDPVVIRENAQDLGGGRAVVGGACSSPFTGDVFSMFPTSGDGSGNHEYDYPGSKNHPISRAPKWNSNTHQWEIQLTGEGREN